MPDNVTAEKVQVPGGPVFKSDYDGTAHVPVSKIEIGDDNSFDGYVSSNNPMPVTITDGATTAQNTQGQLVVNDVSQGLAIANGTVLGSTFVHKFGAAPDFDPNDGFVTVWDGADDGGTNAMQYTYSATADIDTLSSSSASDTFDVEVQGLDTNWNLVNQTVTLTGQTPVPLSTKLIRVFRLKNVGAADNVGVVYCFASGGTVTAGVPQTATDIRAQIGVANNQTLMAIYTVPAGKTAYMRSWTASTAGAKQDSQHTIELRVRPEGQVFQIKHKANIAVTGTSHIQHEFIEPEVYSAKSDIEMRADTDTIQSGVAAGFDIVLIDD